MRPRRISGQKTVCFRACRFALKIQRRREVLLQPQMRREEVLRELQLYFWGAP